jgi:hypothetical protein
VLARRRRPWDTARHHRSIADDGSPSYGDLLAELGAEKAMNELLVEAVSDLELSAEDRG